MHHHPYLPQAATIKAVQKETYDTTTYTMAFQDAAVQEKYTFSPGQFNMLTIFGFGEAPISISSDHEEKGAFQHTIRHVGRVTNALASMQAGSTVWVRGPYGTGWPLDLMGGRNVLIVAGGIGLAPLRGVIQYVVSHRESFGRVELLYGARTPADVLYPAELEDWASSIKVRRTVDMVPPGQNWPYGVGVVTTLFAQMDSTPEDTLVLTCGPEIMMQFVVGGLLERDFDPGQIYVSLERRMSCGVNKCGNCQIGSKFVCRDGPVFAYTELLVLPEKVLGGVGR